MMFIIEFFRVRGTDEAHAILDHTGDEVFVWGPERPSA
jgi:hypothetical protein